METDHSALVSFGRRCNGCARINTQRAKFCNFCGTRFDEVVSVPCAPPPTRLIKNDFGGYIDERGKIVAPKVKLFVKLLSARGLRAADLTFRGGTSDPFCTCAVPGKPETRVKTRHINKTLAPVWDEEHLIPDYAIGDGLHFEVMDHDVGSQDDLLGTADVPAVQFTSSDGYEGVLTLTETGGCESTLTLSIRIEALPELPQISEPHCRLQIVVVSASGLRAADWSFGGGKSDPFCVCQPIGKPWSKVETTYKSKTLEPEWNETFEIPEYARYDSLSVQVYDYDQGSTADLLGEVVLEYDEFDREGGFDGKLRLKGAGDKSSYVNLRVNVLPPPLPEAETVSEPGSRLQVHMISARRLRAADFSFMGTGSSDPFCTCEVLGDAEMKVETKHKTKTLEPVWDETHEIPRWIQGAAIEFKVFDYDRGSAADLLGRAELPSWMFDREGGFSGELHLLECGRGLQGLITVRVDVLPPLLPDAPTISEPGSRLKVVMISATGLRAADWSLMGGGKSDPFCTCEIAGKPEMKVETKHISKTLEPVWNQEFEIQLYEQGCDLEFKVWDHDFGSSADLLGKALLHARNFDREGGFEGDLKLLDAGGAKAFVKIRVEVLPPLLAAAPPVSQPGCSLAVHIVNAAGLRAADWGGKSDPFCTVHIMDREQETKITTKVINKTLNPNWDEHFEIDDYDRGQALELKVFDYDRGSASDLLGRAVLIGGFFDREGGFQGEMKLMDCGKGKAATLNVCVKVLPPEYPPADPISEPGSWLRVTMISAAGLRAADWSLTSAGQSDPFCVVSVRGRGETASVRTRHLAKTLTPEWNEQKSLNGYESGDSLSIEIFDYDIGSAADKLGRAILPATAFDREGGFDGELKLKDSGKEGATVRLKVEVMSALLLSKAPTVSKLGSSLLIEIRAATGLRSISGVRDESPLFWCVCAVRGNPDVMYQTQNVVSGESSPFWAEETKFEAYTVGDCLDFKVYGSLPGSGAASEALLLGSYTLLSGDFDREGGFSGQLRLRDCGKGVNATLATSVQVLPPERPPAPPISLPGARLCVSIAGAKNLQCESWAKGNPYCECWLRSQISGPSFTTRTITKTAAPLWNEEHEVVDFTSGDDLWFLIRDALSPDMVLGKATISSKEFDREEGFCGEVQLNGVAQGALLSIKVNVVNLPPHAEPVSSPGSRLVLTMIRANGLKICDPRMTGGFPDPYCTCEVGEDPNDSFSTSCLPRTFNPVWNEELEHAEEYTRGASLTFRVFDRDRGSGPSLLGFAKLNACSFDKKGGFEGTVKMQQSGVGPPATLTFTAEILPPRRPTGDAEPGCVLHVFLRGATGLSACAGIPDPFCTVCLRGKEQTKFQTKVCKKTTSPQWHENHKIYEYAAGDRLELAVMDHDFGDESDMIGRLCLDSTGFHECGFDGKLPLREGRWGQDAFLNFKVEVLPPGRFPLVVTMASCSVLDKEITAPMCCNCHPVGREHFGVVTRTWHAGPSPVWDDVAQMPEYVDGDALEFQVQREANDGALRVIGIAHLDTSAIHRPAGFCGELRLGDRRGAKVGTLQARVESVKQWEMRKQSEEEDRKIRAEKIAEAERKRGEKLARELQKLEEEVAEREKLENERKIAELAAQRATNILREVIVPVYLWPHGELLVQVCMKAGDTVFDLARKVARASKLPLIPLLRVEDRILAKSQIIVDFGVLDPHPPRVLAESCPAIGTGSEDGTARIWNANTGECEMSLVGHAGPVNTVAVMPDMKWALTASDDETAKIWILESVGQVATVACTLEGHKGAVNDARFSLNGRLVVTSGADCSARIWRLKTGLCVWILEGHTDSVVSATFSTGGKNVKTVSLDGTTKTWDVDTGRCTATRAAGNPEHGFSYSPEGTSFLAIQGRKVASDVEIRSMESGAVELVLKGHEGAVRWASFLVLRGPQATVMAPSLPFGARRGGGALHERAATAAPAKFEKLSLSATAALVLSAAQSRSVSAPCKRHKP